MNNVTLIVAAIGVLAFVISIITQVTKEIGFMKKIPTALEVLVLSLILTPVTLFGYASYLNICLEWYMIAASVVAGFVVAFVCMFGWEKLVKLYERFKK